MTRTLSVTAGIVFAALLYVQFARVVLQPIAGFPPSVAITVSTEPPAAGAAAKAIEDLASGLADGGRSLKAALRPEAAARRGTE